MRFRENSGTTFFDLKTSTIEANKEIRGVAATDDAGLVTKAQMEAAIAAAIAAI